MKLGKAEQQPVERFSYTINYADALPAGDNVASAIVVVEPAGLTIQNVSIYDPRVKFWISGGTAGVTYKITTTMTSVEDRIFQDEINFKIKEI